MSGSTIVRLTWTLPDGNEVLSPAFTISQDMKTLGESKFRMELYADKPPCVEIAPEGTELPNDVWDAGTPVDPDKPCFDIPCPPLPMPMDDGHRP